MTLFVGHTSWLHPYSTYHTHKLAFLELLLYSWHIQINSCYITVTNCMKLLTTTSEYMQLRRNPTIMDQKKGGRFAPKQRQPFNVNACSREATVVPVGALDWLIVEDIYKYYAI